MTQQIRTKYGTVTLWAQDTDVIMSTSRGTAAANVTLTKAEVDSLISALTIEKDKTRRPTFVAGLGLVAGDRIVEANYPGNVFVVLGDGNGSAVTAVRIKDGSTYNITSFTTPTYKKQES